MELTTKRAIASGEAPGAFLAGRHDGASRPGDTRAKEHELSAEGVPATGPLATGALAEDFARGQLVVVARWLLVLAGLLLTLWEPNAIALVRVELFGLLCLAVA